MTIDMQDPSDDVLVPCKKMSTSPSRKDFVAIFQEMLVYMDSYCQGLAIEVMISCWNLGQLKPLNSVNLWL